LTVLPFKPDWGRHPDKMAAALYYARKRKRDAANLYLTTENANVFLVTETGAYLTG
jgi:hypothetical protein